MCSVLDIINCLLEIQLFINSYLKLISATPYILCYYSSLTLKSKQTCVKSSHVPISKFAANYSLIVRDKVRYVLKNVSLLHLTLILKS